MQTFRPEERLRSTKHIERLFTEGRSLRVHPFVLKWISDKENRIRRKMREAYRKLKQGLYESLKNPDERYSVLIIYTGENKPSYRDIEDKITLLLQRLSNEENEKTAEPYTGGNH
jgi:RNase P protein component